SRACSSCSAQHWQGECSCGSRCSSAECCCGKETGSKYMTVLPLLRQRAFPIARSLPLNVGILHFVGIGGIGMSCIAEILHSLGYKIQGSDIAEGANVDRVRDMGIKIIIGHNAANIENASAVVISSAVKANNPEVIAAREHRIPIVRRAEMLAEL